MMWNKHLIASLYKPIYERGLIDLTDKLWEIAVDYVPLINKEMKNRVK